MRAPPGGNCELSLQDDEPTVRSHYVGARSPLQRALGGWRRRWLAIVIAAICLTYAPLSATYFVGGAGGHRLQDEFLAVFVSRDFAYGPGSGYPTYVAQFSRAFAEMLVHTIAGPLALICGLVQLWPRRRPWSVRLHRANGIVFVASTMVVCGSAAIFLIRFPGDELFGGPSFYDMLWALDLCTVIATVLGIGYLLRGQTDRHGAMMLLVFLALLSAPLLRYEWVAIASVTGLDKWQANAIASIINAQLPLIPFYVVRARRGLVAGIDTARWAAPMRWIGGFGFTFCVGWGTAMLGIDDLWMVGVAAGLWVAMYGWFTGMIRRSGRDSVWAVYRLGLATMPAAAASMLLFSTVVQGFGAADAMLAALGTGWLVAAGITACIEVRTSRSRSMVGSRSGV